MPAAALRLCRRRGQRLALALRADLLAAHSGLQFQKFQLRGVQLLAAGAVLLDPLQPKFLLQKLDHQVGEDKLLFQFDDPLGFGYRSGGGGAHAR